MTRLRSKPCVDQHVDSHQLAAGSSLILLLYVGSNTKHVGGFSNYASQEHDPWMEQQPNRGYTTCSKCGVLNFIHSSLSPLSRQLSASGDMIFSHKAGERICLVKYGVADQDDGADFFLDVSRIATSLDNPAE